MDIRFRWRVPESGYAWRQTTGGQQLIWKDEKRGGMTTGYRPETRLFREFAKLDTTPARREKAILTFADKYGDIVALPGSSFYDPNDISPPPYRRIIRSQATLSAWLLAIQRLRRAVNLWDQSNDKNIGRGARLEARSALQIQIESALRDMTTPSCARVCLNQKLELFVYPVNLLAFMWLTLARLVSGEIVERRCMGESENCLGHIYIGTSPGLKKPGTLTCGGACRKGKSRRANG